MKGDIPETGLARYNIKGFIVANGVTDVFSDWNVAIVENLYRFNLIPAEWRNAINDNGCATSATAFPAEVPDVCGKYWGKVNNVFDKLNPYDLLRKNYDINETKDAGDYGKAILGGEEVTYKRGVYQEEYTPWIKHSDAFNHQEGIFQRKKYKLFGSTVMSDYFNNQTVRDTLHIKGNDPW